MPVVDLNGAEIAYRRQGAGETVVALHSSVASGAQWAALSADLQPDHLVLAPDLYGYGESQAWPGLGPIRLDHEAEIVEALIRTCGGPIHLVGHSYGGAVALKAALRGKIALRSLTLIEPVSFHILGNSDPWGRPYLDEVRDVADFVQSALSTGDRNGAMHCFVDYWSGNGAWDALSPRQRRNILDVAAKVPLDFWAAIAETATLEDYAALNVPTLVICGERSPAPVRRIAALLDVALPSSTLTAIAGAGHMLPLTHPEPVNRAVAAHLGRFHSTPRQVA